MYGSKVMAILNIPKIWSYDHIWAYEGILKIAITFEPYIIEPTFFTFNLCFHGLRTRLKQQKYY